MQISLAHNGEFGFEASLEIPVQRRHNGKVANLFHYRDDGQFEFVACDKVKNGKVSLPFTHASEYVVVFSDEAMSEDVSAAAGGMTNNGMAIETVNNIDAEVIVAGIAAAFILTAAVVTRRKLRQR